MCRPVCANSVKSMLFLATTRPVDMGWEPRSGEKNDHDFRYLIGSFNGHYTLFPRVRLTYRCGVALSWLGYPFP